MIHVDTGVPIAKVDLPIVLYNIPGRTNITMSPQTVARLAELKNIVAEDDWVVALYPKFFQIVRKQFGFDPDGYFSLGSAGLDGFEADTGRNSEVYIPGGHSAAIGRKQEIIEYITDGTPPESVASARQGRTLLQTISNLNWILWLMLIAGVIFAARVFAGNRIVRSTIGKPNAYVLFAAVLTGVIYTI